jgi:ABC-type branched-subunit amino acid transport system substrate-binding protein
MNFFQNQVLNYGATLVIVESYKPEQTDFAEPIKKLVGLHYPIPKDLESYYPERQESQNQGGKKDSGPRPIVDFDALFIPDAPQRAGLIIPQLAFYDIENVRLLGTNLWHSPALIEMAPRFSQGAIVTDGLILNEPKGKLAEFIQSYQSAFLESPDLLSATGYDNANLLFTLLSDVRVRFRSSLKTALGTLKNFPGVTGLTSFDTQGEVHKTLYLLRINGRDFETIPSDGGVATPVVQSGIQ